MFKFDPKVLQSRNSSFSSSNHIPLAFNLFKTLLQPIPNEFMKYAFFVVSLQMLILGSLQASYEIDCPDNLRKIVKSYLTAQPELSQEAIKTGLRQHLTNRGFTFAQVNASKVGSKMLVTVKQGVMGKATFQGNKHLSDSGLLSYLNWESGKAFNYSSFQSSAARLNANRFVNVDSKLAPIRGKDGDVTVNAGFSVEDSLPIGLSVGFANDGTSQSSGWRSQVGLEIWEPFSETDKLILTYSTDPDDFSLYNSYALQYRFGSTGFSQVLYAGYSQSEYDSVISTSDINVAGDGVHAGYSASYAMGSFRIDDLAMTFGATFLDTANRIDFYGTPYGEESLTLFLPRLGFRGSFPGLGNRGRAYWSLGVTSDWGTSDNDELSAQRVGVQNGFFITEFSWTDYHPLSFGDISGGVQTKLHWQYANDPLPVTLQKALGGINSIRGYEEREAFGDNGISLNLEYRFNAIDANILGLDGRLQKLIFYDYGYLESKGSIASDFNSLDLSSVGVGILGNFNPNADMTLQVGVPLSGTPSTKESEPRAHFSINLRF